MSNNMIKGYSVAYDNDEKKSIEISEREQMIQERLRKLFPEAFAEAGTKDKDNSGFVAGLAGERIEVPAGENTENNTENNTESAEGGVTYESDGALKEKAEKIIADAQAEAEHIISVAKRQAEDTIADARTEAENAKNEIIKSASEQGYLDGQEKLKEEHERLAREYEDKRKELENEYERQVSELEPAFVEVINNIVRKITGIFFEDNKTILLHMIHEGMTGESKSSHYLIRISKDDYAESELVRKKLSEEYAGKADIEFYEDTVLKSGECMIETDTRIIDCSLDTQLGGLSECLKMLCR